MRSKTRVVTLSSHISRFLSSSFPRIGELPRSSHILSLGVYYAKGIPVPIPNTEVKLRRAYGTAVLTVEESVNAKIEEMRSLKPVKIHLPG